MDISVEEMPARIVGGPTVEGYAVICDRAIREWVLNKDEAHRIACLLYTSDAADE